MKISCEESVRTVVDRVEGSVNGADGPRYIIRPGHSVVNVNYENVHGIRV